MSEAVEAALTTAPTLPRDAAAVALARRYADLLDGPVTAARYRDPLRYLRRLLPAGDEQALAAWAKVAEALAEHSVASDLGPKLLATLTALGMTAAGRSAKGGAPDGPRVPDELGELRARAATRRGTR